MSKRKMNKTCWLMLTILTLGLFFVFPSSMASAEETRDVTVQLKKSGGESPEEITLEDGKTVDGLTLDQKNKTLTMENVNLEYAHLYINGSGFDNNRIQFTIRVIGENHFTCSTNNDENAFISGLGVDITFSGDGSVYFTGDKKAEKSESTYRITIYGDITIDGPNFYFNYCNSSLFSCMSNLTIRSGSIYGNINPLVSVKDNSKTYTYIGGPIRVYSKLDMQGGTIAMKYVDVDDESATVKVQGEYKMMIQSKEFAGTVVARGGIEVTGGNIFVDASDTWTNHAGKVEMVPMINTGVDENRNPIDPIITDNVVVNMDVNMDDGVDITQFDMALSADAFAYTGKAIEPEVTVTGFEKDKDYKVEYVDNINPGKAKAVVTGLGIYTGSKTLEFTINAKPGAKPGSGSSESAGDGSDTKVDGKAPAKGEEITDQKLVYKVTRVAGSAVGEVAVVKPCKKTYGTVAIKDTVKIDGYTYKVTSIGKKAFYNNKKLKKVTIGKKVKSIGASAFAKCKKLKTVTISSKKLKTVGKSAFAKTNKKMTIKVPKSKKKAYKKLLKKKGLAKSVKIK